MQFDALCHFNRRQKKKGDHAITSAAISFPTVVPGCRADFSDFSIELQYSLLCLCLALSVLSFIIV